MMSVRRASLAFACIVALVLVAGTASAHEGPPYPVIVDKAVGPYKLSVWADPDVGTGTFFTIFDTPIYHSPSDPIVSVDVWPSTGRLAPQHFVSVHQPDEAYKALVQFESEEKWTVKLRVEGALGPAETQFEVPVTPPGYGRWDLLIYFGPFALVGLLWIAFVVKKRKLIASANAEA